jgi:Tat protein secretion system quality control protein TatD with DNase activity
VLETAKFVADLRKMPFEDILKITDENAKKFFKI